MKDIVLCDGVCAFLIYFFLTLLVRRGKGDPCVKSGLHLEHFAMVKEKDCFSQDSAALSTLLQLCSVHASPAPAPWLQSSTPYSTAAKCIRDPLACRKTRLSPSQRDLPGGSVFSINESNDFQVFFVVVVANYLF